MNINNYLIAIILMAFILISCEKETSTEPVDENNGQGTIVINSDPEGFQIFLDNTNTGLISPDTLKFVEAGQHELNLNSDIYCDTTFSVNVIDNQVTTIDISFLANPRFYGAIECISYPAEAEILLDDSLTGKITPNTLSSIYPGNHVIKFLHPNCLEYSENIFIKSEEILTVTAALVDTSTWLVYNSDNSGISNNDLSSVVFNMYGEDAIWIGTKNNGIVKFDGYDWESFNSSNSPIVNDNITCIHADGIGHVWVGTENGLIEIADDQFILYNSGNTPLTDNHITSIQSKVFSSTNGTIYAATKHGGVLIIYLDENMLHYTTINSALPSDEVNDISYGNNVAYATSEGLLFGLLINPNGIYNKDNAGLPGNNIESVVHQSSNNYEGDIVVRFWLVINNGSVTSSDFSLLELLSDGVNYTVESCLTTSHSFFINNVKPINTEEVWLCTENGLMRYYLLTETSDFNIYNSGLPSNSVRDICSDRQQNIWIATDNGLVRYNPN